jgi:[ribosomal protein S18]-alanine N-acetyltransferase
MPIKSQVHQTMGLNQVVIREIKPEEVDEILSIAITSPLNPWSRGMLSEEMANPISHSFLIERGNHLNAPSILGFICFRNIGEESELLNIVIRPQDRQMGFGKMLMEFYIDFCNRRGIQKYYLEVSTSNRDAIRLYQSFSFQPMVKKKRFYQGQFDAFLMMR